MVKEIIAELQAESEATRRVLRAIPQDKYDWRPHEKSMPAGELAMHVVQLMAGMSEILSRDTFDRSEMRQTPAAPTSSDELAALHDNNLQLVCDTLSSWSEEKAMGVWKFTDGDKIIMELPRIAAVRSFLLNHIYHHRGQLTVYLRLLGVPVPSCYGPTADVNPFV